MAVPRLSLRDAEDGSRLLPINDDNYWDFEALLRLPYDLFKPIYELLVAGRIFIEDLRPASATDRQLAERVLAEAKSIQGADGPSMSVDSFIQRIESWLQEGEPPAYVTVAYDPSPVATGPDGSPGPFVGTVDVPASADFNSILPNPLQRMAAEEAGEDPKKLTQAEFLNSPNRDIQ